MIRADFTTIEHVCAVFGLTADRRASITPVSRGAVGRIWRLDLGAESFAVKELFRDADEGSVRREVAFAAHVAAAGIRRPASLPDRGGRFLARLPGHAGGGWLRLYQWIDGESVDLANPRVPGQIGDLLGRMHATAVPPQGQADPWFETAPGPATWSLLADAGTACGAQWAPALAQRTGLLRELAALVTPPADDDQLITCHRDLHPGNVLVDASGELVLLDWDDVGPAVPGRELVRLLIDWLVRDGRADGAAVERTLGAYRAAGGQGRLPDERSFSMHIACLLNFLQAQAGVALDRAGAPEDRQYASAEVSDTLTRLPTASLIAQLVGQAALILG